MKTIEDLRIKIDEVDGKILSLVIERLDLVKNIGEFKKQNGIEIVDKKREERVLSKLTALAMEKNIDPAVVKKIWTVLMEISYQVEGEKHGNS